MPYLISTTSRTGETTLLQVLGHLNDFFLIIYIYFFYKDLKQQVSTINLDPIQNKLNELETMLSNQQASIGGKNILYYINIISHLYLITK